MRRREVNIHCCCLISLPFHCLFPSSSCPFTLYYGCFFHHLIIDFLLIVRGGTMRRKEVNINLCCLSFLLPYHCLFWPPFNCCLFPHLVIAFLPYLNVAFFPHLIIAFFFLIFLSQLLPFPSYCPCFFASSYCCLFSSSCHCLFSSFYRCLFWSYYCCPLSSSYWCLFSGEPPAPSHGQQVKVEEPKQEIIFTKLEK